jgi:ADP-dependent NAD(P)H-hydrate dehydratase / NAD(P)H-hydrate epimerase
MTEKPPQLDLVLRDEFALLSCAEMAKADAAAIAGGSYGTELMEAAGRAVVAAISDHYRPQPVIVICGPGNNGGDGFVVARVLAAAGWPVRLALTGSMEALRGDARHHAMLWQRPVEPLEIGVLENAALVVDALFGSGLRRPLSGDIPRILEAAAARGVPIVAVDVPSGLLGDTGESLGAVAAVLTVTFTRKKPGHVLLPGRELCGETVVADIGTSAALLEGIRSETWENDAALWRSDLPQLRASGNKYSRGHALLWGGYPTTGAARMAARAAARAGAGLTTIAVAPEALPIYAAALTSIMVRAIPTPADLDELLADKRFNALLIGPGAGVDAATRARALAMLATRRPVLLDADAISAFAQDRQVLFAAVGGPCVLTPHDGEFARLFDASGDKLTRARAAARTGGAVIVLKGADTVIAAPDGRAMINSNAPSTLATAGSGDVLGGMILGLLAQGMEAFAAAAAGVWLHGAAASDFGPGLLAEDLPDLLPGVLRRLLG